jgi:hypothetical protein
LFSDGTTVWELDYANVAATGGQGDVVTSFFLWELPDL